MNSAKPRSSASLRLLTAILLIGMLFLFSTEACFADKDDSLYSERPLSDYDGKTIAIVSGAAFDTMIENSGVPENPKFKYFKTNADCVKALISGKVDAVSMDEPIGILAINRSQGKIKMLKETICNDAYGIMFHKGSALTDKFTKIIRKFKKNGTFDKLKNKWMGADESVKVPISQNWPGKNGTLECWCGNDTEPMCYIKNSRPAGFSIDTILSIAKELDYKIHFTPVDVDALVPSIESGKANLAVNCLSITEERLKRVDFAETYYDDGAITLLVRSDSEKNVKGFIENIKNSILGTFVHEGRWELFLDGLLDTLTITILSIILGTALGFLVFMLCRKGNSVANKITGFFSRLIHGMPEVVLLMILFYILFGRTKISGLAVSIIAFTLTFAVAVIGLLKTGVNAIDKGQTEAAYALGHTGKTAFFKIVLPQAAILILPGYKREIVALIKASAIVGYIAVQDLTKVSDIIRARTYDAFFPLIATAIIYFLIAAILLFAVKQIQFSIDPKRRKKEKILKGIISDEHQL